MPTTWSPSHGGKVATDWPGLGTGKLFENRDIQPTADLREIAKGLLVQPFRQTVELSAGYWLVWPHDRRRSRKIVRFRDWLVAAANDDPAIQAALT